MTQQTAQVQIYTLSDIENWRICKEGTPREDWEKYDSAACGFEDWVQIGDEDFRRVAERMENGGNIVIGNRDTTFYLRGAIFSSPRQSAVYLFRGSLVTLFPKYGEHVISPESPHFTDSHLLENINLALFSETREGLEGIAEELTLPLVAQV